LTAVSEQPAFLGSPVTGNDAGAKARKRTRGLLGEVHIDRSTGIDRGDHQCQL
jgi:hypothetical protein